MKEVPENLYTVSAGSEVSRGITFQCDKCGMTGVRALTIFIYTPTKLGEFFGYER